jgi:hypothetical protein
MKHIELPVLAHLHKDSPLPLVAEALDALPQQAIDKMPWPDAHEKPVIRFSMAYNRDCIFLKYDVKERSVQARYRKTNDPVYKDSCVEFFIAFNGEPEYYNLEFNCLGTCLAGFGRSRHGRKLLSVRKLSEIRHRASLKVANRDSQHIAWQLTLAIPAEVFSEHSLPTFEGQQARVNFFKCGDELPEPHYLSWSHIQYPQPNFHLPEFFGEIRFSRGQASEAAAPV